MKKSLLLLLAASMLQFSAKAQVLSEPAWQVKTEAHQDASTMKINAPIARTSDGSIYQTGTFDQTITIGQNTLEPIATSAFLAKYNQNGEALWAVALQGSATITAIDADDNGAVIAGVFADEVVLGSIQGSTQTINGMADNALQVSGFIAVYDAQGALKSVKTIIPETDFNLVMSAMEMEMMYFPEAPDTYFKPYKVLLKDDKVYLSAAYTAICWIGDMMLKAKVINVWDFMYMDEPSMAVVSFDREGLSACKLLANVTAAEDMAYAQMQPETLNFTIDDEGEVHVAFVGYGSLALETANGRSTVDFAMDDMGNTEYGMVVATLCSKGKEITWEGIVEAADSSAASMVFPTAVDKALNSYVTGTFNSEFTFAGKTLSPVATSSFLAQYDKYGAEKWAVALQGAATITAIATEDELIAIAGVFADEVVFTSTDDKAQTVNGMADCSLQVSGFVALYDTEGKLISLKTVVPEQNAALLESFMYFPENGDNFFKPLKLQFADGRLYLSAAYAADNRIDDVLLSGKVINVFDFMYMDETSMALVSFKADDLSGCALEANVAASENMSYSQMEPLDMNFVIDGADKYLAFFGYGDLCLATPADSLMFSFASDGFGTNENGAVLFNLTTGASKVYHAAATDNMAYFYSIHDMLVKDDNIYMAGTFNNTLPFNEELKLAGTNDLFFAVFDKDSLNVVYAANSALEEAENCREMISGFMLEDTDMCVYAYQQDVITHAVQGEMFAFMVDLVEYGSGILTDVFSLPAVNFSADGSNILIAAFSDPVYIYSFEGILPPEDDIKVYHAPATDNLSLSYDIACMEYIDGRIVMGGTFSNAMPLDTTVKAAGAADMFLAELSGNELLRPIIASGFTEESAQVEVFTGTAPYSSDEFLMAGYIENTTDRTVASPLNFVFAAPTEPGGLASLPDENDEMVLSAPHNGVIMVTSNNQAAGDVKMDQTQLLTAVAPTPEVGRFVYTSAAEGAYTLSFTSSPSISFIRTPKFVKPSGLIYNLNGMRVGPDYKGIVIRDGKKYMQR